MQAGALLVVFFAWNVSQMFEELEAKQSVMIHRVEVTPTFISVTGVCVRFDDRAFCIFHSGWFDC